MSTSPALTVEDLHRLNRLLEQGLEREGVERSAWLEALGEDDRHLRAVLVDLLNRSGTATLAADARPPTHVARVAADALAAMRREQAGDRIGPWQLERLLAEGGMGAVWVAQRADGVLERTAALKLPRAEWVDHGLAQRIARERSILARLAHPHIAVLYDAGVSTEGRPYLALEYVDGVPIDAWCRSRDLNAVLRLFVQVVRAVAYAHGQLVIHRDLKPANVLVTASGLPKLLDFGISKLVEGDATAADATALTRLSGRPMTLPYAAPEQVLGLPVTVAADVYALGVMLFELVSGGRLYRATTPRELEEEILRGERRRPSEVAVDTVRAKALRGDLDAIVATALKRAPAERYPSATALADDLESYLTGQPVRARPDSRGYRLRKFVARNKLPVAAGAAVIIALGVGLGAALWQAGEAREQAARATALNTFVLSLIQQADPNASTQTKAADVAMLNAIEARIDKEFKGSHDQLLQLRVTIGDAYRNRGEMMAARRVFQRAVDAASQALPADDLMLLTAQVRAADHRLIVSTAAAAQLDRVIGILRRTSAGNSAAAELLIEALLIRSVLSNLYGVPKYLSPEAITATLTEAVDLAVGTFGIGSRQHLRAALAMSELRTLRDTYEAGQAVLADAMRQARSRADGVTETVEFLAASAAEANYLCATGQVHEGLAAYQGLLAQVRNAHGASSYLLEPILTGTGECLSELGDATAFGWIADAYEVAASRERPPSTNLMQRALDAFSWALGARDLVAAERYYRSALENSLAISEAEVRERLTIHLRSGRVCQLAQRGDAEEAVRVALPIIAAHNADYATIGRLTPNQGGIWICLADAQRQLGRYEEALATADTFAERCRGLQRFAPGARCETRALTARALVELDTGRTEEARATMQARMELSPRIEGDPRFPIAYARVMLATGRGGEAVEMLRDNYGWWLSTQPNSPHAAEALYWFGRAYQAAGDGRGNRMIAQARERLAKSPVSYHRALAPGRRP